MTTTKAPEKTGVWSEEEYKIAYETKTFWIFSWQVVIHSEKTGKDLVIYTEEKYDNIIINGEVIKTQ